MQTQQESRTLGPRYAAFISYRHTDRDRRWAEWLLEALERYRVPRRLRAQGFPDRIRHVFRDEDELPSSSDLNDQIKQALARSDYLIVICSPDTPSSAWVCREIELFCEMGRGDRILALLVDGEPDQSFPAPLRRRTRPVIAADGSVRTEIDVVEPLAADIRPRADRTARKTKHLALLRMLACLLGCSFDDLRQRDHQRQKRHRLSIAAMAGMVLIGLLAGGWWQWDYTRLKTEHYATFVTRLGAPVGIGLLNEDERAHRRGSHRFEMRRGQVERIVSQNTWGVPEINGSEGCFWSDVAEWRFHYLAEGGVDRVELRGPNGLLMREESFSADLKVVKFDKHGRSQAQDGGTSVLGLLEQRQDVGERSSVTQHRLAYDAGGFVIERLYEDSFGTRQSDPAGGYGKRYAVNDLGLVVREQEIGVDGRVHVLRNEMAAVLREFDDRGELRAKMNVDQQDRPFVASGEFAIMRIERDAWGNSRRESYLKLAVSGTAVAGERLALTRNGVAGHELARDENGDERRRYFGVDGKPTLHNDGHASVLWKFRAGRVSEVAFYDSEDHPALARGGFHRVALTYDA